MIVDENNPKHFFADEGKMFVRISNNDIYGTEILLGKINVNDIIVDDVIENYKEVEYLENDNQPIENN